MSGDNSTFRRESAKLRRYWYLDDKRELMPTLSLTDFVDVVSRTGARRISKIAEIKRRPAYSPQMDFYKAIREAIVEMHAKSLPRTHIVDTIRKLTDRKKIMNYPEITAGYGRWLGRKEPEWFAPPTALFSGDGFEVRVNPELGLVVNGAPHIIKLYFKGEALPKSGIRIAAHLMEISLRDSCRDGAIMSILDTRSSKLLSPQVPLARLTVGLRGELAYMASVWPDV